MYWTHHPHAQPDWVPAPCNECMLLHICTQCRDCVAVRPLCVCCFFVVSFLFSRMQLFCMTRNTPAGKRCESKHKLTGMYQYILHRRNHTSNIPVPLLCSASVALLYGWCSPRGTCTVHYSRRNVLHTSSAQTKRRADYIRATFCIRTDRKKRNCSRYNTFAFRREASSEQRCTFQTRVARSCT